MATMTIYASSVSGTGWTNPSNASGESDSSYATVTLARNTTRTLTASFTNSLPNGATINSITAYCRLYRSNTKTLSTSTLGTTTVTIPTSIGNVSYSVGTTFPSSIALNVKTTQRSNLPTIYVDSFWLEVDYTEYVPPRLFPYEIELISRMEETSTTETGATLITTEQDQQSDIYYRLPLEIGKSYKISFDYETNCGSFYISVRNRTLSPNYYLLEEQNIRDTLSGHLEYTFSNDYDGAMDYASFGIKTFRNDVTFTFSNFTVTKIIESSTNLIRLGSVQPTAFYLGETQITAIYLCENVLYKLESSDTNLFDANNVTLTNYQGVTSLTINNKTSLTFGISGGTWCRYTCEMSGLTPEGYYLVKSDTISNDGFRCGLYVNSNIRSINSISKGSHYVITQADSNGTLKFYFYVNFSDSGLTGSVTYNNVTVLPCKLSKQPNISWTSKNYDTTKTVWKDNSVAVNGTEQNMYFEDKDTSGSYKTVSKDANGNVILDTSTRLYCNTYNTNQMNIGSDYSYTLEMYCSFGDVASTSPESIIAISRDKDWNKAVTLYRKNNKLYLNQGNSCYLYGTTILQTGKMYHIVIVRDRTNTKVNVYLNGVLEITDTLQSEGGYSVQEIWQEGSTMINQNIKFINFYNNTYLTEEEVIEAYRLAQLI